jgi:hypothetical protein
VLLSEAEIRPEVDVEERILARGVNEKRPFPTGRHLPLSKHSASNLKGKLKPLVVAVTGSARKEQVLPRPGEPPVAVRA